MKTKLLASFTLSLLILTSCEKDEDTLVDSSSNNNSSSNIVSSTNNSSSTSSTSISDTSSTSISDTSSTSIADTSSTSISDNSLSSQDYYPLGIDNRWEYSGKEYFDDMATGETMQYEDIVTGDKIIDGEIYFIVENDGGGKSFVRKSGSDYLMINSMINSGDSKTQIVLKEDGAEGDKWGYEISSAMYGTTIRSVYAYSIFEKLESYEVNGTTYLDVLVMDGDTDSMSEFQ